MEDKEMKDLSETEKTPLFNRNEISTCLRFAPHSEQEDFSLLCTSNIFGQVKLYKFQDVKELT